MKTPRFASAIGSKRWILTLSACPALSALSTDMSLPALPALAHAYHVSPETAQLSLSLFMIGFAGALLVVGHLSDAWGRRPVLLGGLVLFATAALGCAVAPTIELLLVCRTLQGIGCSMAPVVARAMLRDTHSAAELARLSSIMLAAMATAPMIAPFIGASMLRVFDWPAIFAMQAVIGIALFAIAHLTLRETLAKDRRVVASLPSLGRGYVQFFSTPGTRVPLLIGCACFAGQFAYIADSPQVLIVGYGVSEDAFGFYFAATAVATVVGSLAGARILRAGRGPRAMVMIGTTILAVAGLLVTVGTQIDDLGILGFLVPMMLFFLGVGITAPSASALALQPVPHLAGTAAASMLFAMFAVGAPTGYYTTKIGGTDPRIFAFVTLAMGALALVLASALRRSEADQKTT